MPARPDSRRLARDLLGLPLAVLTIAVVLPVTTFVFASWLVGWQLQPVLSGSMRPTYPIGSLLVVGQIDASQVEPGMAVAFDDPGQPGRLVTHRVVRRVPATDQLLFVTQGDANSVADPFPVPARSIRGRVLWQIPAAGYVVDALRWPRGFLILVIAPGALLLALSSSPGAGAEGRRNPARFR